MQRFTDKIAVVTAAGSGIGRATSFRLADEGATVIAIGRSDSVVVTERELQQRHGRGAAVLADCTELRSVEIAFAQIIERFGHIDVLVNNVGRSAGAQRSEFWRSDVKVWNDILNTSLNATMFCCRQVVPHMRERREGKIINISSVAWIVPTPTFTDYAAAKAGVIGFTRVLAVELAPFGVNVNAISPGPVATPATDRHAPPLRKLMEESIPLGRFGKPEEIAAGVAYLASADASFVTGHNLVISGGRGIT